SSLFSLRLMRSPEMTVLDRIAPETFRERSTPVLETERLVLRAPRLEDATAIATLAADRRIAENTLRIPHPYTVPDAPAFLASVNPPGGEAVFLITTRDAGLIADTVIGACGIARLDGREPELGYWLGVPFWGKGYATEAARAVIDHAFSDLGYAHLLAGAR